MEQTAAEILSQTITSYNAIVNDMSKFQFCKVEKRMFVEMMEEYAKQVAEKAFEAGFNRGAEANGSTHGWLGLPLENKPFDEWYEAFLANTGA